MAPQATEMPAPGSVILSSMVGVALAAGGFAIAVGLSDVAGGSTAFWYLSRASGFVAYLLFWASVVWGLLLSTGTGRAWARPATLADAHQFLGNLGAGFAFFHGLVLVGDRYIQFSLPAVLVPFAGDHEPLLVAGGQIGLWLTLLLIASFACRRHLGGRTWRRLHYVSFAAFWMVLAHACLLGTDSRTAWGATLYLVTGGAVVFLTLYRVLATAGVRGLLGGPGSLPQH